MPSAERIEYENAYYHVINRGRGRRGISLNTQVNNSPYICEKFHIHYYELKIKYAVSTT